MKIKIQKLKFQFSRGPTCAVLLMFALLVSLGFWQLHRFHYKKQLRSQYQQATKGPASTLDDLSSVQHPEFHRLWLKGRYLNHKTLLLENRFYQGRPGYDVLTPFQIQDRHKFVLINRGWIPRQQNEQRLPMIGPVNGIVKVIGYIKQPDTFVFILGKNILQPGRWPLLIQKIDIKELSALTHLDLYSFVIRLDPGELHGFVRNWRIINMTPQRHLGYAVQWFAMALALVIAFGFFSKV